MSRVFSILGGLVCLGVAGAAAYAAMATDDTTRAAAVQPSGLIVDEPVRDFGAVGQMESLHAEFRLVNHFPSTVTVKELLKGCACSDSAISAERLEAGQSATLSIAWRTGSRRGKASEVVTVLALPDGAEAVVAVQVRLTAQIEPDMLCEPAEVRFERNQSGTMALRFTPGRMPGVQIRSAYPSVSALQTSVDPTAGTVVVRYDPAKLDGNESSASVMVQTTSPKEPWITVPVVFAGSR